MTDKLQAEMAAIERELSKSRRLQIAAQLLAAHIAAGAMKADAQVFEDVLVIADQLIKVNEAMP